MFNLSTDAVGREDGEHAKQILNEFIQTKPTMVFENSVTVEDLQPQAPQAAPAAPAAPGMGGGGRLWRLWL